MYLLYGCVCVMCVVDRGQSAGEGFLLLPGFWALNSGHFGDSSLYLLSHLEDPVSGFLVSTELLATAISVTLT